MKSATPTDEKSEVRFEKDSDLQTHGNDHQDSDQKDGLTFRKFMVLVAMSFLWISSQIPLYLYGGVIPIIVSDIGGVDRFVWIILGFFIPLAAITPFVGQLSDILGRRHLSLGGAVLIIVGSVVCATADIMNVFIAGMALSGVGAGIVELTALAVAGEMAPVQNRGFYVGSIVVSVIVFAPSVLYAQLVAVRGSWRWLGLFIGGWVFIGLVLTAFFFFPPKCVSPSGPTRRQVLSQIDYIGGFLSTAGFIIFLAGLTWGGSQYPWRSVHVLVPLFLGAALIIAFGFWETYGARHPMFPARLMRNTRAFVAILVISTVSGANFFTILLIWPTQYSYMYADNGDPVSVGLGSLPIAFCILGGSVFVLTLISLTKTKVRVIMILSCIVMTAGNGAMTAATIDNLYAMYAPLVFACLGIGAVIVPCSIIASIICPDDLIATSIALTLALRILGGAVGYAICYSIQKQKFSTAAGTYIASAAVRAGIRDPAAIREVIILLASNLPQAVRQFVQTDAQWQALVYAGRQAYSASFPPVYYVAIGFGGVAIIAACFIPDISQFMDQHIAVNYA